MKIIDNIKEIFIKISTIALLIFGIYKNNQLVAGIGVVMYVVVHYSEKIIKLVKKNNNQNDSK